MLTGASRGMDVQSTCWSWAGDQPTEKGKPVASPWTQPRPLTQTSGQPVAPGMPRRPPRLRGSGAREAQAWASEQDNAPTSHRLPAGSHYNSWDVTCMERTTKADMRRAMLATLNVGSCSPHAPPSGEQPNPSHSYLPGSVSGGGALIPK